MQYGKANSARASGARPQLRCPSYCIFLFVVLIIIGCESNPSPTTQETARLANPGAAAAPGPTSPALPGPPSVPTLRFIQLELGGAQKDEPLPWVVGFHGLGDTPERFSSILAQSALRAHAYFPGAPIAYGTGFDWFGERLTGDESKLIGGIRLAETAASALLERLQDAPQNVGKPVVFGFSQGGMLSFALAVRSPLQLQGSLPLSGWLPPSMLPSSWPASGPPIIAFHGEADRVVPFAPTKASVAELNARGARTILHRYPGVRHQISREMHREFLRALEAQAAAALQAVSR